RGVMVARRSQQLGVSGVEQCPDSEEPESAKPEGDSLGPLDEVIHLLGGPIRVRHPRCQATMWSFHRFRVRPSDLTSGGNAVSWRSDARRVTNSLARSGSSIS